MQAKLRVGDSLYTPLGRARIVWLNRHCCRVQFSHGGYHTFLMEEVLTGFLPPPTTAAAPRFYEESIL